MSGGGGGGDGGGGDEGEFGELGLEGGGGAVFGCATFGRRLPSLDVREQRTGDCFAHAAAICLVRLLQQCYYPRYNDTNEVERLFRDIHSYIIQKLGRDGGHVETALRLCLGVDSDEGLPGDTPLPQDLLDVREHLELHECLTIDEVREALNRCHRPCFEFYFQFKSQWNDFLGFFRDPTKDSLFRDPAMLSKSKASFSRQFVSKDAALSDREAHAGHAVNIRAYIPFGECFELRNTWGCDWADEGKFRIAQADLLTKSSEGGAFLSSLVYDVCFKDSLPEGFKQRVVEYRGIYLRISLDEVEQLFDVLDLDGNGQLTVEEFTASVISGDASQAQAQDKLLLAFPQQSGDESRVEALSRLFSQITRKSAFTKANFIAYFARGIQIHTQTCTRAQTQTYTYTKNNFFMR